MTVKALMALCRKRSIRGFSRMRKAELIAALSDAKFERVERLRKYLTLSKIDHSTEIMRLNSLKEAHAYCLVHNVTTQQYGPLLEKFIRLKYNYAKNKSEDLIGDCSKCGNNAEVKVSLGGFTRSKFNFVQIRPMHDCETYILTAYNLSLENVESEGELYIFKIPKEEILKLIVAFGSYAHGTTREHGKITAESLISQRSMEYSLRPAIHSRCWRALSTFRVSEGSL